MSTSLLIDETPLVILPKLAAAIGLPAAIVVQQVHYLLCQASNGKEIDGERWIYNTYEQWQKYFPFWSTRAIRRIFDELESPRMQEIVVSCQPDGRTSRRKYYRLNHGVVHLLRSGKMPIPDPEDSDAPNLATSPDAPLLAASHVARNGASLCSTETTTKTTADALFELSSKPPKPQRKDRGTEDEIVQFCRSIGVPESDARFFFNKWEGCGWRNGGTAIKDWRATIRSWRAAGYLPSQKLAGANGSANGTPSDPRPPSQPPCQDWRERAARIFGRPYKLAWASHEKADSTLRGRLIEDMSHE